MKVIDPGHEYLLNCLDGVPWVRDLLFVKRLGPNYPGNETGHSGTTSQEVLRALIDRAEYVNNQIPAWQTRLGKWLMRITIWLFEHRAAKRHGRCLSIRLLPVIETLATCPKCGHVQCKSH